MLILNKGVFQLKNRPFLPLFYFFIFTLQNLEAKPPELTPKDARIIINEILKLHANYCTLNQELMQRAFENYLHEIDPNFYYFLEPEIVAWRKASDELLMRALEGYKKEDFSVFEEIHETLVKGIIRRRAIEGKIYYLPLPSDVDASEFKSMSWAKNREELEARLLRIKGLQLKTAERLLDNENKKPFLQRFEKKRMIKEEEFLTSDLTQKKQLILSYVLKAISSALDSQTLYFTPSEANQFMIQVQQRLFGIGAQLRDDLNGFTIVRIIENSPASQNPSIKLGDQIIAIDHEPIIGLEVAEVAKMIQGPENSSVTLTLLRKNNEKEKKFEVAIVRKEIVLKERRLESSYHPFGDGVIGVLKLFSFYQDLRYTSATDLLEAFNSIKQNQKIKGIILDLRSNAGGVLSQAVSVASLFMGKGVVVSVKDNRGKIQRLRNIKSSPIWEGPLIILINKASASAAEIVAQTLQEYGIALIVGDPQTYGKGTFQTFTLEAANYGKVNPKGEYKVTRGRYYTVSGKTPQLIGVASDIAVPGLFSEVEIGEKFSKFPLDSDTIPPSFEDDLSDIPLVYRGQLRNFYQFNLQRVMKTYLPFLPILKKNSNQRLRRNKNYQKFIEFFSKNESVEIPSFGENDLQLEEGIDIMKDLLTLLHFNSIPK